MPGNAMAMHYRGIPHLVTVHYRRLPGVTVRGNDPVMGPEFVGASVDPTSTEVILAFFRGINNEALTAGLKVSLVSLKAQRATITQLVQYADTLLSTEHGQNYHRVKPPSDTVPPDNYSPGDRKNKKKAPYRPEGSGTRQQQPNSKLDCDRCGHPGHTQAKCNARHHKVTKLQLDPSTAADFAKWADGKYPEKQLHDKRKHVDLYNSGNPEKRKKPDDKASVEIIQVPEVCPFTICDVSPAQYKESDDRHFLTRVAAERAGRTFEWVDRTATKQKLQHKLQQKLQQLETPRSDVSVEEQLQQLRLANFELSKKLLASESATINQVCNISPSLPSCDEFPMNVMAADSSCAVRAWETSVPRSTQLKGVKDPSCVDRIADDDNNDARVYPQRGEFISVLKNQSNPAQSSTAPGHPFSAPITASLASQIDAPIRGHISSEMELLSSEAPASVDDALHHQSAAIKESTGDLDSPMSQAADTPKEN